LPAVQEKLFTVLNKVVNDQHIAPLLTRLTQNPNSLERDYHFVYRVVLWEARKVQVAKALAAKIAKGEAVDTIKSPKDAGILAEAPLVNAVRHKLSQSAQFLKYLT
jgi:hypothetical protein